MFEEPTVTIHETNPTPLASQLRLIADMLEAGTMKYVDGGMQVHKSPVRLGPKSFLQIIGNLTVSFEEPAPEPAFRMVPLKPETCCSHVFMSPECGYTGELYGCDKTLAGCQARFNEKHFNGHQEK